MMVGLLVIVAICWFVAIARLLLNSISSDLLIVKQLRTFGKSKSSRYTPMLSVLIPAYNEEVSIERTLDSLCASSYPRSRMEIIVINDGSRDQTESIVRAYKRTNKIGFKIRLINRPNGGKARALNYAIKYCAKGSIIVCIDADTTLNKYALRNMTKYFRNKNTVALTCYADIIEDGSLLALCQRIEYIIGYRTKSGHTLLGANYIISGTGSAFRRSILKRVNYYESNTQTEDLDLTMKIMASKKKNERIDYARDFVSYTEAVHTVSALMNQRYRWTYGRAQVFVKYANLFFSRNTQHPKMLTWGTLPFTLISDITFLLSPIINIFLLYLALSFGNIAVIGGGVLTLTAFLVLSIWSVEHLTWREKLRLSYYAPPMYILIHLTSLAEYYALIKAIFSLRSVKASLNAKRVTWSSPERIVRST
jgi:poly-beta-1,6-N-acetyl-D-glucosamine synthase